MRVSEAEFEAIDVAREALSRATQLALASVDSYGVVADQYRAECAEALQQTLKALDNPMLAGMLGRLK